MNTEPTHSEQAYWILSGERAQCACGKWGERYISMVDGGKRFFGPDHVFVPADCGHDFYEQDAYCYECWMGAGWDGSARK